MRRRISWLVLATTSAIVISFLIPLCLLVRTLAVDRALAAADQEARNVAILVAGLVDRQTLVNVVTTLARRGGPSTTVLLAEGAVIGPGSIPRNGPEVRRARVDGEAFTVIDEDGGRVYLPVVTPDGTAVVRTVVSRAELYSGVVQAWLAIAALGLLLMAVSGLIANRLGRRISEPLLDVAGVAHQLREGDLSARADVRGPEETEELARALNGLAERTGELLVAERAAVADLSHRLRTPVTALRLESEAVTDTELGQLLQKHVRALQRGIDQVVREARRPVRTDLRPACDATSTVRDRAAFWQALAEDQGRPTTVDVPERALRVPVAAEELADAVDVLVDNVFAHTPEPTAFAVRLSADADKVRLEITDDGPGPVTAPGGRPGSTGLGLDIVRRTARAAGGSFTFGRGPGGGTSAVMSLPLLPE